MTRRRTSLSSASNILAGLAILLVGLTLPTPADATSDQTSDSTQLVEKLYRSFADRQPDSQELANGVAVVASDRWQELLDHVTTGDEWLGRFVDDTYQRVLNRDPDPAGRSYWIGQLQTGLTTADIVHPMLRSQEFASKYASNNSDVVNQLFQQILGRAADPGGVAYWTSVAEQHGAEVVADSLFASAEYRRLLIGQLYNQILCRDADEGGQAYWADQLPRGGELELARAIATTDEFHTMNRTCTPNASSKASTSAEVTDDASSNEQDSAYLRFWEERNAETEYPIRTRLLSPDRTKALIHDGTSQYLSLTDLEDDTTEVLELEHSWLAANVLSDSGVVFRSYLFPGPSVIQRYDPTSAALTEIFSSPTHGNQVLAVSGDGQSALLYLPSQAEPVQRWRNGVFSPITSVTYEPWVTARMDTDGSNLFITKLDSDSVLTEQTYDLLVDSLISNN